MTRDTVMGTLRSIAGEHDKVWVAGSAAICPDLAGDIDLWVMRKSGLKPEMFNKDIWADIGQEQFQNYNSAIPGITARLETTLPAVGDVAPLKIQIMFTDHPTIWDLMDYFDCSCHLYARDKDGCLAVDPEATLPGSPVRLVGPAAYLESADFDGPSAVCDCNDCKKERANGNWHVARKEKFTQRYAHTTRELLWLPS